MSYSTATCNHTPICSAAPSGLHLTHTVLGVQLLSSKTALTSSPLAPLYYHQTGQRISNEFQSALFFRLLLRPPLCTLTIDLTLSDTQGLHNFKSYYSVSSFSRHHQQSPYNPPSLHLHIISFG